MAGNGDGKSRIPSLDGLRAASILIVMVAHSGHFEGAAPFFREFMKEGATGVNVFFVISGFLITGLLRKEKTRHQSVDLKAFYLRRIRRIFPAYYLFFFTILLLTLTGVHDLGKSELLFSSLYVRNFLPADASHHVLTGHLWSLAVEEHFYLVWPVAVALLSHRNAIRATVLGIVFPVLTRMAILFLHPHPLVPLRYWTPCRMDAIMMGCLLALMTEGLGSKERRARASWAIASLVMLLGLRALDHLPVREALRPYLGEGSMNLIPLLLRVPGPALETASIAILLLWCVENPLTLPGRVLNASPVAWLGRISYSLYLWHVLSFAPPGQVTIPVGPLGSALVAIGIAAVSYHFVESAFMRVRVPTKHDERSREEPAKGTWPG